MAAATSSMASPSHTTVVLLCAVAVAAAFFATADAKTSVDGDLMAKSCAAMRRNDWWWWFGNEKFCESRLRLDKRSAVAKHPRDLVLIAMDLAERAVADADAKVAGVLRSGADGHHINDTTALILRHCRLDYASAASTIPVCRAIVEDYKNSGQQLAPNDYFECARRLRRDTHKCFFRSLDLLQVEEDVYMLVYKKVEEACQRSELVDAMLEEMLGIVINDHEPTQWI